MRRNKRFDIFEEVHSSRVAVHICTKTSLFLRSTESIHTLKYENKNYWFPRSPLQVISVHKMWQERFSSKRAAAIVWMECVVKLRQKLEKDS